MIIATLNCWSSSNTAFHHHQASSKQAELSIKWKRSWSEMKFKLEG